MADLAKLASLSKRLKTSEAKTHEDRSPLGSGEAPGPGPADDNGDETGTSTARAPAPAYSAPASSSAGGGGGGGGGGPAPKVTVNVDMGPVTEMLGRIRDELRNLREEVGKTRKEGMKIDLGGDSAELLDQALKHLSAVSKASRELTEKVVTSMPESRWYADLINLGREVGEGIVAGGGGGGGGNAEEITAIKEQLEMQKTQLTAILSILQRR
ncbi:MAG: hypothetical protein IT464_02760 [Planctomycetes bacterium]|nr:hypothetical protein [Planctomycetota bacterium]